MKTHTINKHGMQQIEISEHQTISGHTEFIYVTDEGIDTKVTQEVS